MQTFAIPWIHVRSPPPYKPPIFRLALEERVALIKKERCLWGKAWCNLNKTFHFFSSELREVKTPSVRLDHTRFGRQRKWLISQKHLHLLQGGAPAPLPFCYTGRYELQREWRPLQRHTTTNQDLPVQVGAPGWHGCGQVQPGAAFCQGAIRRVPGDNHRRWRLGSVDSVCVFVWGGKKLFAKIRWSKG